MLYAQIDAVYATINENLKPGPVSERNYGLYYPDGTPVYNIGLEGYLPEMVIESKSNVSIHSITLLVKSFITFF